MKTYVKIIIGVVIVAVLALVIVMLIKGRNAADMTAVESEPTAPVTAFVWRVRGLRRCLPDFG